MKILYIEPGSSWDNGTIELFNGKLSNKLLNMELLTMVFEAQGLIENWRKNYNQIRPHKALGYRPPASEALILG